MLVLVRQAERTDLVEGTVNQGHVRLTCEAAAGVAGQPDQSPGELLEGAEQADNLFAFAGVRQQQGDVVGMDHAKVAVNGAGGVEDIGAGAGGVEGAGQLLADVRRLAGAGDGHAATATAQQLDGLEEGRAESFGDQFERGRLGAEHLPRIDQRIVLGESKRGGRRLVDLKGHGTSL